MVKIDLGRGTAIVIIQRRGCGQKKAHLLVPTRRRQHDVVGCCGMSLRQRWRGLWLMLGMGIEGHDQGYMSVMVTVAVRGGLTGCEVHRKFCRCLPVTLGLMLVAVITEAKVAG